MLANILECGMLVSFGLAWPANILNSLKHKTAKGQSPVFRLIVLTGYCFGLSAKFVGPLPLNYVAAFYLQNMAMVSIDIWLYFHYKKLDALKKPLP